MRGSDGALEILEDMTLRNKTLCDINCQLRDKLVGLPAKSRYFPWRYPIRPEYTNPGPDRQYRLLLFSADAGYRRTLSRILEPLYQLLSATGDIAFLAALTPAPDLVICDAVHQQRQALRMLSHIKTTPPLARLPVLLVDSAGSRLDRSEAFHFLADGIMGRDDSAACVHARLHALLQNRAIMMEGASPALSAEDPGKTWLQSRLELEAGKHYSSPDFGAGALAANLAMSPRTLQRQMQAWLNTSPNAYLRDYRLHKARTLLRSGWRVADVTRQCGFRSQAYFGRCFREHTGISPGQFRRESGHQAAEQSGSPGKQA